MKEPTRKRTRDIALMAMMIAVITVSAQITVPLPSGVPVTLQTFAVAFCGYALGWKRAIPAVFTYLLMGMIGIPVFSAFNAGFGALFGKTGGFLLGFLFLVAACSLLDVKRNLFFKIGLGFVGLALCHAVGVLWFSHLTGTPPLDAALLVSVPFLIKDAVSVVGAALVSLRLAPILK